MHGLDAIRLENSGVPGEGYGPGFERGINERLFCASKKVMMKFIWRAGFRPGVSVGRGGGAATGWECWD